MFNWQIEVKEDRQGVYHIGLSDGRGVNYIFTAQDQDQATDCAGELEKWLKYLKERKRWGWAIEEMSSLSREIRCEKELRR